MKKMWMSKTSKNFDQHYDLYFPLFYSGDELTAPSEPLIDVLEGGQYSGDNLADLIRSVKEKILSNIPAEEFRVCISFKDLLLERELLFSSVKLSVAQKQRCLGHVQYT